MNCPSCGTELPDTAKFCGSCGYQMTAASAVAATPMAPAVATPTGNVPAPMPVPSYDEITSRGMDLPIGEILGEAWELMKPNFWLLVGGLFVLQLAGNVAANTFIGIVVLGPLMAGFDIVCLRLVAGRPVEFGNLFDGFKAFVPLMLLGIVKVALIGLGSVLFVLPGIYLGLAFTWAYLIAIDRGEEFWPALMASMRAVNGSFLSTFVFLFVVGLVAMLGLVGCGLGLLVTVPLAQLAIAVAYKRNFGIAGGAERLGM